MHNPSILIIGAGIGGLATAIALGRKGMRADLIERDPEWSVYGVGIIQQSNVVRAMHELGILQDYLDAGVGFDFVDIFAPNGQQLARVPSPKLVPDHPANVGIGRRALQKVLATRAREAGATVRLGIEATALEDDGQGVTVHFSDGSSGRYDLVIGADGLYSTTRRMLFSDAPAPEFTGQGVWRYNFPREPGLDALQAYEGPIGMGLVPLGKDLMYLYVTSPEPGNPRYEGEGLAAAMRAKLAAAPPRIAALAAAITDDAGVVYRPLEWLFLEGPWHKGNVVLLGDAVHATTPHLGQGAGMAIEDGIVLAEELARHATAPEAFAAWQARRIERCRYIVDASRAICESQLGRRGPVDQSAAVRGMFEMIARPL